MAVKDVKKYYEEVENQYMEMRDELREFEKLAEENMFEPERIDAIKESIQPLMRNYEVLSYVMYLLNRSKHKYILLPSNRLTLATLHHCALRSKQIL